MGKDLVHVVQCSSDARSGHHGTPLTSKVRGHANPTETRSRGLHRANHGFLRNLTNVSNRWLFTMVEVPTTFVLAFITNTCGNTNSSQSQLD